MGYMLCCFFFAADFAIAVAFVRELIRRRWTR